MDGQSIPPKTPEQIRAERIAAIDDPKLRQQLDEMVKARDAELAQVQDRQKQTLDKRVEELRDKKIEAAHSPQLTPPGYRSPYLGHDGPALAETHAKTQIQTNDIQFLKNLAREHNDQIDKRLDAPHEATRPAAPQRSAATNLPAPRSLPKPNRYAALIESQNYAARAKEAEANRAKENEQDRQQQRERGPQR